MWLLKNETAFVPLLRRLSWKRTCVHLVSSSHSFRNTIKTPTAFSSSYQIYLFTFYIPHSIMPCLTNYATFFRHTARKKFLHSLHFYTWICSLRNNTFFFKYFPTDISHVKQILAKVPLGNWTRRSVDLLFWRRSVKTRVVLKYIPSRKVGRWKDELVNGSFTQGSLEPNLGAHPPSKSLRNLARPNDPHNCIVMSAAKPRTLAWLIHNEETWKKSQRDCPTRGESLGALESVARYALPFICKGAWALHGTVDGIAFSRTRIGKTRRNSAEIGSFRCKAGWSVYSLS